MVETMVVVVVVETMVVETMVAETIASVRPIKTAEQQSR